VSSSTTNYGLKRLLQGDRFSEDGYQYSNADRVFIDAVLKILEVHDHTGGTVTDDTPTDAPDLILDTTAGSLPADSRIYYKYTLVDDGGLETAPSPEAFVDTPSQIGAPGAPVLSFATTGGTHSTGQYSYALSAYETSNTSETKATNFNTISVTGSTSTNVITLTLPSLPDGADGFNVYRLKPGGVDYVYLDSIDMSVATPPTTYDDDNSVTEDCNRFLPTKNTTSTTNGVTISIGGATPAVPDGFTWKIYRTTVTGDYSDSFLKHVVEETTQGSGVITPTYEDAGGATTSGEPPSSSKLFGKPGKIDLTDGASVENRLPLGHVTAFPYTITFNLPGILEVVEGETAWVCPFLSAKIIDCVASLKKGTSPVGQEVIADVNKGSGVNPTYTTIFTTQSSRPSVPVGQQIGDFAAPQIVDLVRGDSLTVDVDAIDDGATPMDVEDLTVSVNMLAVFTTTTSDNTDWS
jgi:hypothetical protein